MINSMTGYGRFEVSDNGRKIVVEMNSVNHRYLDLAVRMPKLLMSFDDQIKKIVKAKVARGKLELSITYQSTAQEDLQVTINKALGDAYLNGLRSIGQSCGLEDNLKLSDLLGVPDLIVIDKKPSDEAELAKLVTGAVSGALTQFTQMREKEGTHLAQDLKEKNDALRCIVSEIEKRSPSVVIQYESKLKARLKDLLNEAPIDENRIAAEVCLFADKCAIDEELTRLKSHMNQMDEILSVGGVVGRKLDFLMQEMNREANTIGSKANDYEITKYVVTLKTELEKIREQVQNIE